ncbi:MAG TPA: protein kinase family protein, partial [Terriglobales bacterium]|nr:protein kinase family protein [Terriglobales bacterium]
MSDLPKTVGTWFVVRELGKGGQGSVYLVRSPQRTREIEEAFARIGTGLNRSGAYGSADEKQRHVTEFLDSLATYTRKDTPDEMGAGKIYNIPAGPLADKAMGRLKVEFDVLRAISSPHILRIVHSDLSSRSMISEYYPQGTLAENRTRFIGRPLDALLAFRGLVGAAAELHSRRIVHRDVKPANIFIGKEGRLVLGDFGIVFVETGNVDRLTDTFERVGTRD